MDPIEPTANVERPKEVTRAVQLISASFAIGGIRAVFDLAHKLSGASFLFGMLVLVVFLGICFFFVSKIGAGRNWARIIFLVLFLIGLPLSIPGYIQDIRTNLLHGSVSIIVAILQLIGMYLLFTRNSNLWFRKR
jgi:4-amino-4-deoxy-L-arabinose transferase-like glycosyltransferase